MKPLVKWLGGKTRLSPKILDTFQIPIESHTGYHEPFCGGAGLFCHLHNNGLLPDGRITLSDVNEPLIRLYELVRDDPEFLIRKLRYLHRKYHHPERDAERLYYEQRDLWNSGQHDPWRFVFLKQTAVNGLWRVNKQGKHNASWGKYDKASILDEDNIRDWADALQDRKVELHCRPFDECDPESGDLVYLDPPYIGTFTGYTAEGFGPKDHMRVMRWAAEQAAQGVVPLYSNSGDAKALLGLAWPGAEVHTLPTTYTVNTTPGAKRKKSEELLAWPST